MYPEISGQRISKPQSDQAFIVNLPSLYTHCAGMDCSWYSELSTIIF